MQYPFKNIANRCIKYRWVSEDTEVIKYLDCDMFFTLCLVNDELSFFSNEDDVIKRIQQLSLQFSKSDVYVSPIWAMQSLETGELVFTEKHIEEIFSFMLNKLLPSFDSKNSHIASMIHEIVNCEWCDEECRFPKGANFLREYFMENQISKFLTHNDFSSKMTNGLFRRLDWRRSYYFGYDGVSINDFKLWQKNNEPLSDFEQERRNKNPQLLFKNVVLRSNIRQGFTTNLFFQNHDVLPDFVGKRFIGDGQHFFDPWG